MYQKLQSYEVKFLRYRVRKNFLSFSAIFCPFTTPNNPENQNFEKMKKASGDVIILNLCNKKHNHMMYAYSDMECDRHFRPFSALFLHSWPQKLKFGDIILLHMCIYHKSKSNHVGFLGYKVQRTEFFAIFCPLTLLTTQKIKILKK